MQLSSKKSNTFKVNKQGIKTLLINLVIFFSIFCLVCILLSVIFSLIFYYSTENPNKMVNFSSFASLFLSSMITSFIMSKKLGERYLLNSLLLSGIILITLLFGAIFTDTRIFSLEFLLKLLVPVFCMVGAFWGKKRNKNHKKRYHR